VLSSLDFVLVSDFVLRISDFSLSGGGAWTIVNHRAGFFKIDGRGGIVFNKEKSR
jgi:hypothetical protein